VSPASTFEFAERYCVESIDYALAEIRISIADEELGEALHVEPGAPLLHLKESHYSVAGQFLGFSFIDSLTSPMRLMVLRRNG
jgi:DNA-binding GntR family transcriptional regulator